MGDSPIPEEVDSAETYPEGAVRHVWVNAYERSGEARRRCIAHYGARCAICGFDFAATYGPIAADYIHVHHIRPLASLGADYDVDPITDLIPVCPNCHAVIHLRTPPLTPNQVRALASRRGNENTVSVEMPDPGHEKG